MGVGGDVGRVWEGIYEVLWGGCEGVVVVWEGCCLGVVGYGWKCDVLWKCGGEYQVYGCGLVLSVVFVMEQWYIAVVQ